MDFGGEEVPELTPEQDEILRDIQIQLHGPGLSGWPQLGADAAGRNRTLVEGLAAALRLIAELRTEISDLEATTAELSKEVRRLSGPHWPWPLSLLEGPAGLVGEGVSRLESLLREIGRNSSETTKSGTDSSTPTTPAPMPPK